MKSFPTVSWNVIRRWAGTISLMAGLVPSPPRVPAGPQLLAYDFNLGSDPVGNVDYLHSLGFAGLVTRCSFPADVAKLTRYANYVPSVSNFQLLAYVNFDFNNPDSPQVWLDALPVLASIDAPLWVIVKNAPTGAAVQSLLLQMAQTSQTFGVETVIYPHWNTDIEDAAQAAAYISQIGHANISNSLHTCHEIRSGNQYSLEAVVATHASDSKLVTIAGADENAYSGPLPSGGQTWSDAIQPLDRSRFSLLPFLQELHDTGYNGPIILQTFGITHDPGHLDWSLRAYARYRRNIR